jgi:hypothetical protein
VTTRKRRTPVEPKPPRADAPEHPIDPADAAFLDPAAVTGGATPAPPANGGDTPGYGDFEGERAGAGQDGPGGKDDRRTGDGKTRR